MNEIPKEEQERLLEGIQNVKLPPGIENLQRAQEELLAQLEGKRYRNVLVELDDDCGCGAPLVLKPQPVVEPPNIAMAQTRLVCQGCGKEFRL